MQRYSFPLFCAGAFLTVTVSCAANAAEQVLYESAHIRFVKVSLNPGINLAPGKPYKSVVFGDTPRRIATPTGTQVSETVLPPDSSPFPYCFTEGATTAGTARVDGSAPQVFFRIDYKRVDGKAYATNWKAWHGDVLSPPKHIVADPGRSLINGTPHSKAWPYDIRYSATTSAPANHTVRYEDDHLELIEVAIRPGETEHMHGHPYPSIYADDGGFQPDGAVYRNATLGADTGPPWGKQTGPMTGPEFPICFSAVPEAPHSVTVVEGPPQHFYRVHFKQIIGAPAKTP